MMTGQKRLHRKRPANRVLEHDGRSMMLVEWSEKTGISTHTISDRIARGWTVERALTMPVTGPRGSYGNAKLTVEKALAIRERLADGDKQKDIAADFGVSDRTISDIATRTTWSHV